MEDWPISIVESTKELVISPNAKPIFRTAHFLNPILTSNHQVNSDLNSLSLPSPPPKFDPQNGPLSVRCHGWMDPPQGWKAWVSKMASLHSSTWKKAGIYDAIFSSTYNLPRNRDLLLGVAEKWCPNTNSFIFPWGEATITLEDMLIAGFSVLGLPVFEPIETEELKEIRHKLAQARLELVRTPSREAKHLQWMRKFVDCGSQIEHEAFLSLWLSRFVFPSHKAVISEFVFPIAIHLAGGSRIALAPAVLASIYRDLASLKQSIVVSTDLSCRRTTDATLVVNIFSPFQLVLIWVWERFQNLQPKPNLIKRGEPRFAQWNNVKCRTNDVRLVLDSSRGTFCWRPYCKPLENWDIPKFYKEKEMRVSLNSDSEELLAFIRCLRVSDLVGLDCIVQYLPHRVARQFGYDQDMPGYIVGPKTDPDDAWNSYIRPVGDSLSYIPPLVCESGVTTRYLDWLKSLGFDDQANSSESKSMREEGSHKFSHKFSNVRQMIIQNLKKKKAAYVLKKSKVSAANSKGKRKYETDSSLRGTGESTDETQRKNRGEPIVAAADGVRQSETAAKSSNKKMDEIVEANNLAAPPGFPPKCGRVHHGDSSEEDSLTIANILKLKEKQDILSNTQYGSEKKLADKAEHSSLAAADNEAKTNSSSEISEEDNRTIAEILKHKTTQEVISNWRCDSSKYDKNQLTNLIVSGGNESPKDSEPQEPTVAENGMVKETGGPEQDVESEKNLESNGKNKRCKYSLVETLEKLEERVRRIETKIAARKALLNISAKRG